MFINTKAEAKLASKIAIAHGFERLTSDKFFKRYVVNVFNPWASDNDARAAQVRITEAIREDREAKRRPTPAERAREAQAERERVAHDISARTGERYNDVLKSL